MKAKQAVLAALLGANAVGAGAAVQSSPNFPSFSDYGGQPYNVSWDGRSFFLDGERALYLSGSVHGPRGTPATWAAVLDAAVENGLNMIEVYVFWNYHKPSKDGATDWTGDGGNGDLNALVQACGERGLFVNLRIGPYVCAEWDYGGLPVWLGFEDGIEFRRWNQPWMALMSDWVTEVVDHVDGLFAHQGGPIVLAQIENELDASDDPNGTAYIEWCGELAVGLVPEVPWLMCMGDSSELTINSCNGYADDCTTFIEEGGQSGRVLVDYPAVWTENEGGFQLWGDDPEHPSDYFWGQSSSALAYSSLRWFARGGSHMNYYMYAGLYNRGRWAAAGLSNMYAVAAPLCPNGSPHQPKYDHLTNMHHALQRVAPVLLADQAQVHSAQPLQWWDPTSEQWQWGTDQRAFIYGAGDGDSTAAVAFVESNATIAVTTLLVVGDWSLSLLMPAASVAIVDVAEGRVLFNSGVLSDGARSWQRQDEVVVAPGELQWNTWAEPIGADSADPLTVTAYGPLEQTSLMRNSSSQYLWYETEVALPLPSSLLTISTDHSNAFVVYVDGQFAGAADDHSKAEGQMTLTVDLDLPHALTTAPAQAGGTGAETATLALLSESLGIFNLIGRWGGSTFAKLKGITGAVTLGGLNLTDGGQVWRMRPALYGESLAVFGSGSAAAEVEWVPWSANPAQDGPSIPPGTWATARFPTPARLTDTTALGTTLMLRGLGLGRGHLWLNGHDLGRFWNITRADGSGDQTQEFYHLPTDWLAERGGDNNLTLFDALGAALQNVSLVLSAQATTPEPVLSDDVDSPAICLS